MCQVSTHPTLEENNTRLFIAPHFRPIKAALFTSERWPGDPASLNSGMRSTLTFCAGRTLKYLCMWLSMSSIIRVYSAEKAKMNDKSAKEEHTDDLRANFLFLLVGERFFGAFLVVCCSNQHAQLKKTRIDYQASTGILVHDTAKWLCGENRSHSILKHNRRRSVNEQRMIAA